MAVYAMSLKETKNSNGIIFKTNSTSLEEAKEYFRKLKQLSKEEFDRLFTVLEIKN
jgi:hypothetical protein|tara:strand:- start:118 stop:285 length:168 start_codon:yes stop_codon:yes gene_type:complete